MKQHPILFLALYLTFFGVQAQNGTVDTSHKITSKLMKREMSYSVYLPPDYHTSTRSYPVLYLFHGMTGDHTDWAIKGEAGQIADRAIKKGDAPPMIIIMPDGLPDAFYINNYDGSVPWEDFFYRELLPEVEKKFRIKGERSTRAIAGLSMGGYGALYHGIKYKELFTHCYAMSAAVLEREAVKGEGELSEFERTLGLRLWGPLNEEGFPENYKAHSIHEMIKVIELDRNPADPFPMPPNTGLPKLYIDCGDDDFLLQQNTSLVHLLREKRIPFEFRVRDGGHTWEYWRTALKTALVESGDAFRN